MELIRYLMVFRVENIFSLHSGEGRISNGKHWLALDGIIT